MLPLSRVIVSLVYYNSLIRDTLEYTIYRDKFDPNFFKFKQYGIINEVKLNTPLKSFLDSNGEKGETLRKKLETFGETFYGEKSTILKPTEDNVRVDVAQNVQIFDSVCPIHEELNQIILLHFQFLLKNKEQILTALTGENGSYRDNPEGAKEFYENDVKKLEALLSADENFYRAVAFQTLGQAIIKKFEDFNKAMREANGEKTPQASFIENELQTLIRNFYIVSQNATTKEEKFTRCKDLLGNGIEMMSNKRALPTGKTFVDVFNEIGQEASEYIILSEEVWRNTYQPAVEEMKADLAKLRTQGEK